MQHYAQDWTQVIVPPAAGHGFVRPRQQPEAQSRRRQRRLAAGFPEMLDASLSRQTATGISTLPSLEPRATSDVVGIEIQHGKAVIDGIQVDVSAEATVNRINDFLFGDLKNGE